MAKQRIIIDDRPLEMLTKEELDEKWVRKCGVPYTPPTKEEIEELREDARKRGII